MFNKNKITLETRENKLEKIKKKGLRKTLFTTVMSMGVLLGCTGMLVGCGEAGPKGDTGATGPAGPQGEQGIQGIQGVPGVAGSMWFTGTAITGTATEIEAIVENTKVGDLYFNTTTCDLYQCVDENTWNWISNIKGDTGEEGEQGVQGVPGETGQQGEPGLAGQDGISAYVGYDGYIWNGAERTEFSVSANLEENVVENTIGIEGIMSKYFEGSYIDLSSNTIALMANYMSNAKVTQYSDSNVLEIAIVSENEGTLHIGTAKVSDIVTARTTGVTYTANTTSYNLNAGLNRITLNINVAEDETIVLGGSGSTAKLYVATGIRYNDEVGNFTLVNGKTNADVISNNGTYADTLAVQVKATFVSDQTELTPSALDFIKTTELADTIKLNLNATNSNFIYTNNYFNNSQITKIGIPIKTVKTIGADGEELPFFTLKVVKHGSVPVEIKHTYKVNIPYDSLKDVAVKSSGEYTIDRWVYIDVSSLNIELEDNENLAFFDVNDTVIFGYKKDTTSTTFSHNFAYSTINSPDWDREANNIYVAFDVYGKKFDITLEEHLAELVNINNDIILANALHGKNISILGDSISTYINWSNNTSYNTTLESNGTTAYDGIRHGVPNVNETWWKQTIDQTGMNLLVDNAKSGAKVSDSLDRAKQLHSDVGDDNGTNPDIIAIWIGINDVRYGTSATDFAGYYRTMIEGITTKYNDSDVYVFTLIPQKDHQYATDETIQQVNAKIREIANEFGCTIVDLYNDSGINLANSGTYMYDYLHPNTKGMDIVTNCFKEKLFENYVTKTNK